MYDIVPRKAFKNLKFLMILPLTFPIIFKLFIEAIKIKDITIILVMFIFVAGYIYMFYYQINTMIKDYKKLKYLNENGKLVKGLVYTITTHKNCSNEINHKINITYVSKEHGELKLVGYRNKEADDNDGYADIIIDEKDPKNYIIKFEINRKEGNRKEDYYDEKLYYQREGKK